MKVWRWNCEVHRLSLLTMQTGGEPPAECSGLAFIAWPDEGPCRFRGYPILTVYATPTPHDPAEWLRSVESEIDIPGSRGVPGFPSHSLPPEPGTPLSAGGATPDKAGRVSTPPLPATRPTT